MILAFTLTMPNNNSWNGKWSGDDDLFCKCVWFHKMDETTKDLLLMDYLKI